MTNDTRAAFEAWMAEYQSAPLERCPYFPEQYKDMLHQVSWDNWLASRRAALEDAIKECERLLELAGNEDQSGLVVAINTIRALGDEGANNHLPT